METLYAEKEMSFLYAGSYADLLTILKYIFT